MSGHSPIRQDKTCQNCRHVVAERFCPNCGQENTESRKTFYHLFVHFFEDLTHYENAFWKTIHHLLFRPGRLTRAYLSGRRLSYLAPVRLYIFISFVTFLLIGFLANSDDEHYDSAEIAKMTSASPKTAKQTSERKSDDSLASSGKILGLRNGELVMMDVDSAKASYAHLKAKPKSAGESDDEDEDEQERYKSGLFQISQYKSVREFDVAQARLPESKRTKGIKRWFERSIIEVNAKSKKKEFRDNYFEAYVHNVPKALFLYMPIFAFWLWVFHGKKRWYYFDHGIFTLHYFSFMLLTLSTMMLVDALITYIDIDAISTAGGFLWLFLLCWWFFYFFRSHSRFYGEPKAISRLKGVGLYIINMWLLTFFTLGLFLYTALNMH